MSPLSHLIYVSSTSQLLSEAELKEILIGARTQNEQHDITGMLLYNDGNVMQVIEGEPTAVETLFSNIQQDPRHNGIIVLVKEAIAEREFPDWRMSYQNISGQDVEGFSDFLSFDPGKATHNILPGKAIKLLNTFKNQVT
ncbi:BLUF domain-containing protein [Oceanicoccus sagamiensis]|uniref:BLUF domain-containing protein n=1 Tax=Oceanicoccus sagamiensis TaxID=716816 RepID=A0A1X9NGQ2_9GAMM|nr:BLUF domain-containing protein [Oceanicoccus sagamiensis]ARN74127.1 hypothetical protein BST96_08325 [Oceanicoccus sagamiensis]